MANITESDAGLNTEPDINRCLQQGDKQTGLEHVHQALRHRPDTLGLSMDSQ